MQRWDVYISIKAKRQPIQSVIIKSIEQNMTCVYEARRRILEFSSQSVRVDSAQVGVANGKIKGEFESSGETSLTSSISSVSEIPNRSVQIPMSFSEDRIASKAGFTSSGSYTTMAAGATSGQASFSGSGLFSGETKKKTGGWEDGDDGNESGSGLLPPEITVNASGQYYIIYSTFMYVHV